MDIGRWDDAIRYFERVRVRTGNRDLVILRELARAWMNKGQPREAGRYAALAYRLQPASLDATVQYADIMAYLLKVNGFAAGTKVLSAGAQTNIALTTKH